MTFYPHISVCQLRLSFLNIFEYNDNADDLTFKTVSWCLVKIDILGGSRRISNQCF